MNVSGASCAGDPEAASGLSLDVLRALTWIPGALLLIDASGVVCWANPRAQQLFRRPMQALCGQHAESLLGVALPPVEAALDGSEGDAGRALLPIPDGHSLAVLYRFSALVAQGTTYRAVFVQDASSVDHLRAERDRLMQFAAVHEMLPSLLHELKTPLASVLSSIELLVEETPEGPFQASLYALLLALRRMKLNIEAIGLVGRPLRSSRDYPVDHAVLHACQLLEASARGRGVTLRSEVAMLPLLPFDPPVMRAVVFNLVSNALYACRTGDEIAVSLGLDEACTHLVLSVRDSGCGMSPEVVARCRELFFTTRANGTGLGLSLCDAAAQAAQGSLTVESALSQGTTVTLSVPLSAPRAVREG